MPGDALPKLPQEPKFAALSGTSLPSIESAIPGPQSQHWIARLEASESPGSTARRAKRNAAAPPTGAPSIVWSQALGSNVLDADGNVFVDLCAGFGVASIGHRHPAVVQAGKSQLDALPHAMGDVFADVQRIQLMERLASLTGMPRVCLGTSGSDAIEIAVKTAILATGRSRIVAFDGGYHGLTSAPLAAIGYQTVARKGPFRAMLGSHVTLSPFGGSIPDLSDTAAVLIEPVQGRGGMRAPPKGWLAALHRAAREAGALVIHDEVYCGLGRAGSLLAAETELDTQGRPVRPDLLCVGKALGGGFPMSACLGTEAAMGAWAQHGNALHTQTFLGNPLGCAMALAALSVIVDDALAERAAHVGERWAANLRAIPGVRAVTGRGLMLGVVIDDAPGVTFRMLQRGYIVLPCGENSEALGLTPPLNIPESLLDHASAALRECL